jgi:hypothetical protein
MISACGLLDLSGMSDDAARELFERVYEEKYRAGKRGQPSWRRGLRFRFDPEQKADSPSGSSGSGTPSGPSASPTTWAA